MRVEIAWPAGRPGPNEVIELEHLPRIGETIDFRQHGLGYFEVVGIVHEQLAPGATRPGVILYLDQRSL